MDNKNITVSNGLDIEKAVEMVGGSRFELILIAATRSREIAQAHNINNPKDIKNTKPNIQALREIEDGKIGREYLDKVAHTR